MTLVIESHSAHETKSWGRRLASVLEGGELLGLMGDLGAGKTVFIKGLASGLNLREEDILSPTFTDDRGASRRMALYHIDLYRLEEAGLDDLGLREYLFTSGVAAVEWFERLRESEELEVLSVRISYVSPSARRIQFVAASDRYEHLLERLRSRFA